MFAPHSSIPPPPTTVSTPIKKRKKEFTISSSNNIFPDHNSNVQQNRILMAPHLHYGLDRFGSIFTIMDKDNILTHSPTMVSFGGKSFSGIHDTKLFYLDLDPSIESIGSMNVEYEWKELKAQYVEGLTMHTIHSNFQFCKKRQSLLYFHQRADIQIFEFSLKTREWTSHLFKIDFFSEYLSVQIDQSERYFIYMYESLRVSHVKIFELDQVFGSMGNSNGKHPDPLLKFTYSSSRLSISQGTVLPILDENKIMIMNIASQFDAQWNVLKIPQLLSLYLDSSKPFHSTRVFEWNTNGEMASIVGYPNFEIQSDLTISEQTPKKFLISLFNSDEKKIMLFMNDSRTPNQIEKLTHNSIPIQLKRKLFFETILKSYITRKHERRAILMPSNDLIFILKLDYLEIQVAFPFLFGRTFANRGESFTDITVICC